MREKLIKMRYVAVFCDFQKNITQIYTKTAALKSGYLSFLLEKAFLNQPSMARACARSAKGSDGRT